MLTVKDIENFDVHPTTVERLLEIYTLDTPISDMDWHDVSRIDMISDEAIKTIFASVGTKISDKELKLVRKANYEYYSNLVKIESERLANFELPPTELSYYEGQEFFITDRTCSFCSTGTPVKSYGEDVICKDCYIKTINENKQLKEAGVLTELQMKAYYQMNRM